MLLYKSADMSESEIDPDLQNEPPAKGPPWAVILVVAVFAAMTFLAFWVNHEKKTQQQREAYLKVMDKELSTDEEAVKAQREKVLDLTKRLEELRTRIQYGGVKDGKASIAEFNKLAAEQRAERDKFIQMADQYNQKVAKYHQLEQ
jgi:hypothetical protein